MKYSNFQPVIIFKKDNHNRCFLLFSHTAYNSFSESKLLNIDMSNVSCISLIFNGFDFSSKDENNNKFVDGELFLNLEYSDNSKDLIKILNIKEKVFESGKSESFIVSQLKKEVIGKWQYCFNESYTEYLYDKTNIKTRNKAGSNKKVKDKINFKKMSIFFLLLLLSAISVTGYAFLKKSGKAENTEVNKMNLSTDPQKLAESQKNALDQTFSELGIDRKKVDSDLSCFQE